MTPRGIRNNNPGNIRKGPTAWQGEVAGDDPDFCTFSAPEWGVRAIARILLTYQAADGCRTLRQIVGRWAPPSENDTDAYLAAVAGACATDPDQPIDLHGPEKMAPVVAAIIRHENGEQPYPPTLIAKALALAGLGPPPPSGAAQAA